MSAAPRETKFLTGYLRYVPEKYLVNLRYFEKFYSYFNAVAQPNLHCWAGFDLLIIFLVKFWLFSFFTSPLALLEAELASFRLTKVTYHVKADILSYPKMWYFLGLVVFKVELLAPEVESKLKKKYHLRWR